MKLFKAREVQAAKEYSLRGQALHVWDPGPGGWPGAPLVFQRNRPWAHLFDMNEERLLKTARRLGVRRPRVDRRGELGQHIDLCGKPLERAMKECEENGHRGEEQAPA